MQTTTNIPATNTINPYFILLYTCSTINSVMNRYLIQYTCSCDAGKGPWAYTNGGHQDYSYTTTMKMLAFESVYNKKSLANVISFYKVMHKSRITTNPYLDPYIKVHIDNSTSIMFKQWSRGLYYYDMTNMTHNIINIQVNDYTFMKTLYIKKVYFRQCEIKVAD